MIGLDKIDTQHHLIDVKATNWGHNLDETQKPRSCVTAGVARLRSFSD